MQYIRKRERCRLMRAIAMQYLIQGGLTLEGLAQDVSELELKRLAKGVQALGHPRANIS